jgi:hypothetical protein
VNYTRNSTEFHGREPAAFLQPYRQKPKLGDARISLDMNMRRFAGITRVEKEAVGPAAQRARVRSIKRIEMFGARESGTPANLLGTGA